MSLKIKFINPNSIDEVDKYLPKILAAAVINKISRSQQNQVETSNITVKHSA